MVIMSVIFTNAESTPILVHGVCSVAYCTVFVSIQDTDKICKGDPVLSTGPWLARRNISGEPALDHPSQQQEAKYIKRRRSGQDRIWP